jgi:hypothetical protein
MSGIEVTDIRWCTTCLTMSTRPRITFSSDGRCNACLWSEQKTQIDWLTRTEELETLLAQHRRNDGQYDCLVPMSGGKMVRMSPTC